MDLKSHLPEHLQLVMGLASEKGASNWVTTLPIASLVFALHKVPAVILSAFDATGHHPICHPNLFGVQTSMSLMLSHVQQEALLPSGTTKFVTC